MTGGLLEKNILFLKGNYFEFFKFLTEYNAAAQKSNLKFSIKIQDSDAAIVECFVNDDNKSLYFEGKYNPKLTFERLIKSEYSENLDAYFVMEFLGGYEIKKIIEIMKNNKIHIVYLIFYPEIFYEIIRFIDISFLKNFNVDFVFGKNKIEFNERLAL
ncbi:MAG TPA: hypothetical protein PLJ38_08830, partial [bacterium]|nr:hypothetical protein [bacterium]